MKILDHLAQAAAVVLLIELLVLVLIFAGVSGGLAFGLHWLRGKTRPAADKAQEAMKLGQKYVDRGVHTAATPVIKASGWATTVNTILDSIQARIRSRSAGS